MRILRRIRAIVSKAELDAEMTEEMRLHLELQTERNVQNGMNADDAHYAARRKFGGVEQIKEQCRDQRGFLWLENICRDVRFAARSLRRAPGFSLAVIATFALCIGPTTAILTVLYALVLKPLPFHQPEQMVQISNVFEKLNGSRQ